MVYREEEQRWFHTRKRCKPEVGVMGFFSNPLLIYEVVCFLSSEESMSSTQKRSWNYLYICLSLRLRFRRYFSFVNLVFYLGGAIKQQEEDCPSLLFHLSITY
ncbi:hypothetical protein F2P56_022255 [Juglans regia]|uniref:Uncharacterized protein n=1 Tax=Juglans regia TaxID=51240 RepID=A0A833UTW2_JUGRE|nr:hypothetical protein F2P56_022255 [Juglans regia]